MDGGLALALALLAILLVIVLIIAIIIAIYRLFEWFYYRSKKFNKLKQIATSYVRDCNALNEHITNLKCLHSGFGKPRATYGHSKYYDDSVWNYRRPELSNKAASLDNIHVHECSRTVCSNSQKNPLQYVCKYFNISVDEETLSSVEATLNDFEAVEQGKMILAEKRNILLSSIWKDIPFLIKKFGVQKFSRKLGFIDIDLSTDYFPRYIFEYTSSGGYSSLCNEVVMDIDNLNEFVEYLNERIKWKKSIKGQRSLMTSALRQKILQRDGYKCKKCGANVAREPNLLLEVDHIIPLSKGGMTKESNLQTLCWRCNRSKGAKIENM